MNERIFKIFNEINVQGIGNEKWGMCKSAESTKLMFGTTFDKEIRNPFVYIFCSDIEELEIYYHAASLEECYFFTIEDSDMKLIIICL